MKLFKFKKFSFNFKEEMKKYGEKGLQYVINYKNENEFKKKERAIKKYNILAYKKLLFDYYPSLREGNFQGVLVATNEKEKTEKYELTLPTDKMFVKIHGNITLHYTVYKNQRLVMLDALMPEDILGELSEDYQEELPTYKGVLVSKSHKDLDMFKINLLDSITRDENNKQVNKMGRKGKKAK